MVFKDEVYVNREIMVSTKHTWTKTLPRKKGVKQLKTLVDSADG